ncbi:MAG TPA: MoaD/ThiS family protein [Candidatus Cybelea sp.]|jgi:molybdopterin converting factor small subunit|nr:MoaD/ThiS family protein [Candidatus Cybelea sp.]
MNVRVIAFANLREILEPSLRSLDLPQGALVAEAWTELERLVPALRAHRSSLRIARNGRIAGSDEPLVDGDELALLPPVGGG